MDEELLALIFAQGGALVSTFLEQREQSKSKVEVQWPVIPDSLPGFHEDDEPQKVAVIGVEGGEGRVLAKALSEVNDSAAPVEYAPVQSLKGEKVATSCVGCAIGHLATVSGLLKEAVRFADEGMASPNIISRLNTCLDELNAMERVDLQPNKIVALPDWEKELAHEALNVSRETRHFIEAGISSADELEKVAANLINTRDRIGGAWLQQKLRAISKEDKEEIQRRVMAKLNKIGEAT